ncbi:MAG: enoyl-CoA hydratase-related protein, partial [Gammaproteobacteria bacterium]
GRPRAIGAGERWRQEGAIAIITGLTIAVLIGFLGIGVDLGRLFVVKSELQSAMDACALAASSQLRPGLNDPNALDRAIAYGRTMHETARAISECRHPTLAQIHGICVGGGLEIAALCDMRICGEGSRFGAPIKNLGLVMAFPEMAPLVALVGPSVTLEILYEGRIFGAQEAKEKGLVNRLVPDDQVADECRATAQRIADGAPMVARWHKKFVRRLAGREPLTEAEYFEAFDCFDTEDFQTGYRAFLAKTKPEFAGR